MAGARVRGFKLVKAVVGTVIFVGTIASSEATGTINPTSPASTFDTEATYPPAHNTVFDLSGKWRLTLEMEVGRATPLLELVEKEGKLSGTYTGRYGSSPVEGTVEGRTVAFTVALDTTSLVFQGEIKDDGTLAGKATFGELGDVTWTAAREK